jgi:hypothetical protein
MDATTIAILTFAGQLAMGTGAWRLATKVAKRQDATDRRVDGHEKRLGVLETRAA